MSIRALISTQIQHGNLVNHQPSLPGEPVERTLLLTTEVEAFLKGPWGSENDETRAAELASQLDQFVSGGYIAASLNPIKKRNNCYMAILKPEVDRIWCIRSVDPEPSIRVFGAFAEKDVFVAMNFEMRKLLGGLGDFMWRREQNIAKARWRTMFAQCEPLDGGSLDKYISKAIDASVY